MRKAKEISARLESLGITPDNTLFNLPVSDTPAQLSSVPVNHDQIAMMTKEFVKTAMDHSEGLLSNTGLKLHEVIGVSRQTLHSYKKGNTLPPLHTAGRWVVELGLPTRALMNPSILFNTDSTMQTTLKTYVLLSRLGNIQFNASLKYLAVLFGVESNFRGLSEMAGDLSESRACWKSFQSDYYLVLGRHLRTVRFKLGMSQDDFGDRFDVTGGTISSWEAGKGGQKLVLSFLVVWGMLTLESPLQMMTGSIYSRMRQQQEDRFISILFLISALSETNKTAALEVAGAVGRRSISNPF